MSIMAEILIIRLCDQQIEHIEGGTMAFEEALVFDLNNSDV